MAGLAFAELAPVMTSDYLVDERFETTPEIEAFVRLAGIRAVISAPLIGDAGPLGVLSVVSREPGAYSDDDVETVAALATQASIAITNANLMDQLARSRTDIQRRASAEQALREIGASLTAMRDPSDVLQRVADESVRLLRADGAVIDQFDPDNETLRWAYDSGISDAQREGVKLTNLRLGEGVSGKAVAERRVITVGDYMAAEFEHDELADSLAAGEGLRDLIVAPIVSESGPLGAIEVFSRTPHAFDPLDAAFLGSLAEQAAIAITNARLIEELRRSQTALARRAETERSLRDITARIAALHDPEAVLGRVVEDAMRLLRTDGAHLTRMDETGSYLTPVVVAGVHDFDAEWLMGMQFPLGDGINGLAAQLGAPVATFDYLTDPRIPHEASDLEVADTFKLRGMAATPLRAPGGEVMGTLAVSSAEPRMFEPDELDLLAGLADQAAIALTNSNLLVRLTREEARFRGLVQTTPDVIWRADTEGRFTFMADSGEALFGWSLAEVIGQHFSFLTHPGSLDLAGQKYAAVGAAPDIIERVPLLLVRRDGSTFEAEVTTTGVFEDGRWVGNQGTVSDVSERARLERELSESEERYRYLVQNAPDLVWSIDADSKLTFLSDACERLTGFKPEELLGQHFGAIVHESSRDVAEIDWTLAMAAPTQELRGRISLLHRDGSAVPAEFIAVASLDASGRFSGANGSVRDMRERDRLEHELRRSEERYRFLVDNSPDIVFAIDPDGRFSYMSESVRRALGRDPGELRRSDLQLGHPLRPARSRGHALRGHARRPRPRADDAHGAVARRRPAHPVRGQLGRCPRRRRVRRHPRRGPRHRRARAPGAGPARLRVALSLPRRELAGRALRDGPRRPLHVPVGGHPGHDRLHPPGAHRPAHHDHRRPVVDGPLRRAVGGPRGRARRARPGRGHPARQGRPPDPGRHPGHRPGRGRRVRGHPGRDPGHERPGPSRDRAAPPGRGSWPPGRSAPTLPASSTTRSPRPSSR